MEVKGTAVASIPTFVRQEYGNTGYQRWIEALPAPSAAIFRAPLHATEWYPLKNALVDPTQAICDLFHEGKLRGAWACGRFSAAQGLRGVYRIFVSVGSPAFLIRRAGAILPTYYRPCRIAVAENVRGRAVLEIPEFPAMHPVVEHRICGWVEQGMEISGCKKVDVRIARSLTRGDAVTEIAVEYE